MKAPDVSIGPCVCGGSDWLVDYDFEHVASTWKGDDLAAPTSGMWRFAPVLPAPAEAAVTLIEGSTPLLAADSLGRELGFRSFLIKDEGRNPGGSFEARGMSVLATMAKMSGKETLAFAAAASDAAVLAAYAARARLTAQIVLSSETTHAIVSECEAYGARVDLVDGTFRDMTETVSDAAQSNGWFDAGLFGQPYRREGEKTAGYEIAEHFSWELPDAIVFPCRMGVPLWKAFNELERLQWISTKRPRMMAVRFSAKLRADRELVEPFDESLLENIITQSNGAVSSVTSDEAFDGLLTLSRAEGLAGALETGACVAALRQLRENGLLQSEEKILFFNGASGLRSPETFSRRFLRRRSSEQDKLGGLITPR